MGTQRPADRAQGPGTTDSDFLFKYQQRARALFAPFFLRGPLAKLLIWATVNGEPGICGSSMASLTHGEI